MHTFYHVGHIKHDPEALHKPDTPQQNKIYSETASRVLAIYESLKKANLGQITPPGDFGTEPIDIIHDYGMLNLLQDSYDRSQTEFQASVALPQTFALGRKPPRKPRSLQGQLGYYAYDIASPLFEYTWETAYWSVQTALSAAALVSVGNETIAYALCRPPGHHTGIAFFGGGCYLNNAAITANWLLQQGRRVAILDIDYHHGNGTQDIFYKRSDVLYCSLHADPLYEYPYYWGYADEYGVDRGLSYTYNFPLPRNTSEKYYLDILAEAIKKIRLYVPDILVLSLGFDTLDGDPTGNFKLEPDSFFQIGKIIQRLGIPVAVIQEGGSSPSAIGESAVSFFKGLLPEPTSSEKTEHDNSEILHEKQSD
jgi:acetoin utilization deacetylase AcuC-like enzyme